MASLKFALFILKIINPFALVKLIQYSFLCCHSCGSTQFTSESWYFSKLVAIELSRTPSPTNRFNYSWTTTEIVATTIREYLVLFDAMCTGRDRKNLVLVLGSLRRYYWRRLVHLDVCAVLRMETHPFDSGILISYRRDSTLGH